VTWAAILAEVEVEQAAQHIECHAAGARSQRHSTVAIESATRMALEVVAAARIHAATSIGGVKRRRSRSLLFVVVLAR
jgi:hypothetical protein